MLAIIDGGVWPEIRETFCEHVAEDIPLGVWRRRRLQIIFGEVGTFNVGVRWRDQGGQEVCNPSWWYPEGHQIQLQVNADRDPNYKKLGQQLKVHMDSGRAEPLSEVWQVGTQGE